MEKSKDQKLLEIEQKIRLLERKNALLEKELEQTKYKSRVFRYDDRYSRKGIQYRHTKKSYSEQSSKYKEEESISISGTCRLRDKQAVLLPSKWSINRSRQKAKEVVEMIQDIRLEMPRIGTRKLYYMLHQPLKEKKVGRDKLFDIL